MDDLNYPLAVAVLGIATFLIFLPGLIVRLGALEPTGPHPESPSELNHRLDDEARQAAVHDCHGCHGCGERCDTCGERMCAEYGPEPVITCDAHHCCVDCDDVALTCTACAEARALAMIEEIA